MLGNAVALGFTRGGGTPPILWDGNSVAWFDMAKNITKDGSNRISEWGDYSESGHPLLQAGADSIKPVLTADGVLFDGVDDYLKCASFTLNQPEFIYIVFRQLSWTRYEQIFDGNGNSTGYLMQDAATPDLKISAGTQSGVISPTLNTFVIVRALFNGASSKLILNDGTPVTGNFGAANMMGFTLGVKGSASSGFSHCEVKEAIIRKIADTAPNEAAIYNYLKDKYSL